MTRVSDWFDIPVSDMDRAIRFYEAITKSKLERMNVSGGKETAILGEDGCLFKSPEDKPSHFGSRVYFTADPSIEEWIRRIESAGGKILLGKTPIGNNMGYFAYFEDSEGNRVGLHSR